MPPISEDFEGKLEMGITQRNSDDGGSKLEISKIFGWAAKAIQLVWVLKGSPINQFSILWLPSHRYLLRITDKREMHAPNQF